LLRGFRVRNGFNRWCGGEFFATPSGPARSAAARLSNPITTR
jgi:hypothetical protein